MSVSIKCQYGLRALFELSRRWGTGLVRIPDIAEAQDIPVPFLENIMNQLRQGGFVESRRGKGGGVQLSRSPKSITVADVIRFMDGRIFELACEGDAPLKHCKLKGNCIFMPMWQEAKVALENVYSSKTLQDLLDADIHGNTADFCI